MRKITIWSEDGKVEIVVLERSFPEEGGTWEGDWVASTVSVDIPGYKANFEADLRTGEFVSFLKELEAMNSELKGTAAFEPLEKIVEIKGEMNSLGGIVWEIETSYPSGGDTVLQFTLGADQSYLPALIQELKELLEEFPVLEKPEKKTDLLRNMFRNMPQ